MWESVFLTLMAAAGNNIGKVLQKKGTVILPPLSFKLKSEEKKRRAQYAVFREKRDAERKMAAVAREKAWAERLVELHRVEAEKKAMMA